MKRAKTMLEILNWIEKHAYKIIKDSYDCSEEPKTKSYSQIKLLGSKTFQF